MIAAEADSAVGAVGGITDQSKSIQREAVRHGERGAVVSVANIEQTIERHSVQSTASYIKGGPVAGLDRTASNGSSVEHPGSSKIGRIEDVVAVLEDTGHVHDATIAAS